MKTYFYKKKHNTMSIFRIKIHLVVLFFGVLSFNSFTAQTMLYQQDFEKGGKFKQKGADYYWGGFKNSLNYPTIEKAPQRNGKAGKFYLHKKGDGTTLGRVYRTEVVFEKGKGVFEIGKEYWLSIDYMFTKWNLNQDGNDNGEYSLAPFQVHTTPPSWDKKDCGDFKGGALFFPFSMGVNRDRFTFITYKVSQEEAYKNPKKDSWSAPIEIGKWFNVIVHFKISYGNDGFIKAWKDGVNIIDDKGRNTYQKYSDSDLNEYAWAKKCTDNMRKPYLKMGVYKGNWRPKNQKSQAASDKKQNPPRIRTIKERELYIDNFKLITDTSINPFGGTLATDEFNNIIDITISPNPSSDELTIQFSEATKVERVSIYDILGKEVFTKKITSSETKLVLKPNLVKGIYIVKIASEEGHISEKIIIE